MQYPFQEPSTTRTPVRQRRDIQGLRAVAVLAVVANHVWPQRVPGGFVGVDIFFVISGFLITGLLLREYEASDTISFTRFYTRRVKRLMPAATLTIAATVVAAFAILPSTRAREVVWDGVWSFLFAQNWHLAISSTDYFNENESPTPLQHYWSLSVEEQFYLVWPWLLLLLLALFARRARKTTRRIRAVAGIAIGVISVASFGWALHEAVAAPSVAYFSTLSRGWELGSGALIAVVSPVLVRQPQWLRVALTYSGLAAMGTAIVVMDPATVWPAPGALLPVLGAALVLISGVGCEARLNPLLTNRAAVYFGDISYSLYLWHFPVIIYGGFLYPDAGRAGDVGLIVLSFALAVCAFHLVEEPIHKSPLWIRRGADTPAPWKRWYSERRRGLLRAAAGSAVAVGVTLSAAALAPSHDPLDRVPEAALTAQDANSSVVEGLRLEEWPEELTPTLDAPRSEKYVAAWSVDGCLAEGMRPADEFDELSAECVFGDPTGDRTVVILGDSVAITWATALEAVLEKGGWRVVVLTAEMCPASGVAVVRDTGTAFPGCSAFQERAMEYVRATTPELVLLSETATTVHRLASKQAGKDAVKEVSEGFIETIAEIESAGSTALLVESVPRTRSMRDCFDEWAGPASCALEVEGGTAAHERAVQRAGETTGVPVIDTSWYFCIAGVCPPVVDGFLTRPDGAHPSDAFARHIGPSIWADYRETLATFLESEVEASERG